MVIWYLIVILWSVSVFQFKALFSTYTYSVLYNFINLCGWVVVLYENIKYTNSTIIFSELVSQATLSKQFVTWFSRPYIYFHIHLNVVLFWGWWKTSQISAENLKIIFSYARKSLETTKIYERIQPAGINIYEKYGNFFAFDALFQ